MKKDVIIALDFDCAMDAIGFLERFPKDRRPYVKIGMELFFSEGADIVRRVKDMGHEVFLDLKLCDIPNTVERSMRVLSRLGVDMTNLHAFGTKTMMKAALEGLTRPDGTRPILIAVTQLTSTGEEALKKELMIDSKMSDVVASYAMNARDAGLDGVVCSPLEAAFVKETCGKDFIAVTPGIRFADSASDDQTRIMTPKKAGLVGSDYIVVGRPITRAADPVAAYDLCVSEFLH